MKKILYLLGVALLVSACNSKGSGYDPYKIDGGSKERKVESKSFFEVKFKETASNTKTIHVRLNNSGHDVIFDTGCSGISISRFELEEFLKYGVLSDADVVDVADVMMADSTKNKKLMYNIKKITLVDTNGKEHILTNIVAAVEENPYAPILVGNSVIDGFAKKSYTVDLGKKVIRFE